MPLGFLYVLGLALVIGVDDVNAEVYGGRMPKYMLV